MRRIVQRALVALTAVALARTAFAQALGPQRQFLAIEPYYEHTNLDVGVGFPKENLNGYGGRLWINLDPFHFIQNSSIALYTSYAPKQGAVSGAFTQTSALHFGAEYDQFFLRRPLGGVIDPFFTVGVGRYRLKTESVGSTLTRHYTTLTPGGGIRI
ncbi:MAG: hypothetical protein M3046_13340, partial [Actinomycetota bacterium]|nr:hypothetical protein [Actinomycetota bacterium]